MSHKPDSPWGLDILDAQDKENQEKINQQQDIINKEYAICFSTDCGKKVLKNLEKLTIEQPTWIPEMGRDGKSVIHNAFVREGQNSIVRMITDRIKLSKNDK